MNALLNVYPGDAMALAAAHVVLQILLLVLLAWLLGHLLARRDPAIRHGLWVCALLGVLLSPLAVWTLDAAGITIIAIPLGKAGTSPAVSAIVAPATVVRPEPQAAFGGVPSRADRVARPRLQPPAPSALAAEEDVPPPRPAPTVQAAASVSHASLAAVEAVPGKPSSLADRLRPWAVLAATVWAAGVLFLLARLLHGWLAIRRLRRALTPVAPQTLGDTWVEVCRALGAQRLPPIALTRVAGGPMTMGLWQPTVVLPEDFLKKLAAAELRSVLVHECAHALRRDSAIGLLQRLAAILFWPHPAVHVLNAELARAREEVCDNFVLRQTAAPDYVGTLMLIAQTLLPARRPAMIGLLEHRCRLEHRAAGLLDPQRKISTRLPRGVAAVLVVGLLAALFLGAGTRLVQAAAPNTAVRGQPQILDLAPFYGDAAFTAHVFESILGRRVIDGLPFDVGGRARLYGQTLAERHPELALPDALKGIRIGRAFDELHLIHYTEWPDVEGQTIAYIVLNYADGTRSIVPIRYGVQVTDWYFLTSYEKGLPTDANSKVCWQRAPLQYKAPIRLFKSKLLNPWPAKTVDTLDVVSARSLTCYVLVAATVADRDPQRPVSPPVPAAEPERQFDGKLAIRVVDDATGKSLEGALVAPTLDAVEEWVVGVPLYTSSAGAATIPYPIKQTTRLAVFVKREGYSPQWEDWQDNIPASFTVRLAATGGAAQGQPGQQGQQGSLLGTLKQWWSPSAEPKAAPAATGGTRPLLLIDADGSHLHGWLSLPEYTVCGSPEWSRDGSKIAFDARRSLPGETCVQNHVFVAAADGSWIEDLGPGGMPSWSPDGRQIAFSHWQPQSGVSIMNADGTDRRLLDAEGWGAEWSPRRNEIAYVISPAGGQKLCIYDVASQDRRTLLGKQNFRHIPQGFTWSPSGENLCFKGLLPDGTWQLAAVHREGAPKGFQVLLPNAALPHVGASPTVSWGGNGQQILTSLRGNTDRNLQIYVVDFTGREPPKLLPGQDPLRENIDPAWSPDGKRIVFASAGAAATPQGAVESSGRKTGRAQTETVMGQRPRGNCSLSGTVISAATAKPVAHARMYLFYLPTYAALFVNTADDGTFTFQDIPKGPYCLQSSHTAGYQDAHYNPQGKPGPLPEFSLQEGEHRSGIVLKVTPAYRILGKIVDEKGQRPAHLDTWQVLAWVANDDGKGYHTRHAQVNRADGSYVIDGLGAKPVYVMALNWRAAKLGNAYPPIYYPSTFSRRDARRIAFDKGQRVENVNITLRKEGGLILEGTVRDEAGHPVPEAFVVAHHRDMLFDFATAYTDEQGHYQIQGLGEGDFLVHVDAVHRGLVRTRTSIDLAGARKTTRLNFTLARGATLSGRLVDQQGHDWQIAESNGYAHVVKDQPIADNQPFDIFDFLWPSAQANESDESGTFSLTDFRNKHRPKDAVEGGSAGTFALGAGDYKYDHMLFPTKNTFLIQGMMPGHTIIGFSPQKEGQAVVKILHDGRNVMQAGLDTKPGQEIKDLTIVIGQEPAKAAAPAVEKPAAEKPAAKKPGAAKAAVGTARPGGTP